MSAEAAGKTPEFERLRAARKELEAVETAANIEFDATLHAARDRREMALSPAQQKLKDALAAFKTLKIS